MSLEATRYLWSARLDPRRRTYAIGTYADVLDQWGIFYDQPIVLNRRQAGAAIEGALRQRQVGRHLSALRSTRTASRIWGISLASHLAPGLRWALQRGLRRRARPVRGVLPVARARLSRRLRIDTDRS